MKIRYTPKKFNRVTRQVIDRANQILETYTRQGYDVTLRQLYYQFIALNAFPEEWLVDIGSGQKTKNHERNYKKLGELISNARLGGLIDWDTVVDRTRTPSVWRHDESPQDAIELAASRYNLDKWTNQNKRVEVWVEKEALSGVFQRVCHQLDVPLFACRGYVSQSAQWEAHQRFVRQAAESPEVVILHFGDHDPSGLDMTRDIQERLSNFNARYNLESMVTVKRLALNIDQIKAFNPPPSPAKMKDPRADKYIAEFGEDSWELDALNPQQLNDMVRDAVMAEVDPEAWALRHDQEATEAELMKDMVTLIGKTPQQLFTEAWEDMCTAERIKLFKTTTIPLLSKTQSAAIKKLLP